MEVNFFVKVPCLELPTQFPFHYQTFGTTMMIKSNLLLSGLSVEKPLTFGPYFDGFGNSGLAV